MHTFALRTHLEYRSKIWTLLLIQCFFFLIVFIFYIVLVLICKYYLTKIESDVGLRQFYFFRPLQSYLNQSDLNPSEMVWALQVLCTSGNFKKLLDRMPSTKPSALCKAVTQMCQQNVAALKEYLQNYVLNTKC